MLMLSDNVQLQYTITCCLFDVAKHNIYDVLISDTLDSKKPAVQRDLKKKSSKLHSVTDIQKLSNG